MSTDYQAALDAIDAGDVEALLRVLDQHPDLATATDDDDQPLLMRLFHPPSPKPRAADLARTLLAAGANAADDASPLAAALCTDQPDVARALLEHGADLAGPSGYAEDVTVLDLADLVCENLDRHREPPFRELIEVFSAAAGRRVPRRPSIGKPEPILWGGRDVKATVDHYLDTLGFELVFVDSADDCRFAIVRRGAAQFLLAPDGRPARIRLEVDDVDALHDEMKAAGAEIKEPPRDIREVDERWFEIRDPARNELAFCGPIPDRQASGGP